MKELNRKIMYDYDEKMGCGPFAVAAIYAEITVKDGDNIIFLSGTWTDIVPETIQFAATKESIFNLAEKMATKAGDENEIVEKMNSLWGSQESKEEYEPYYDELLKMIIEKANEKESGYYFEDLDELDLIYY